MFAYPSSYNSQPFASSFCYNPYEEEYARRLELARRQEAARQQEAARRQEALRRHHIQQELYRRQLEQERYEALLAQRQREARQRQYHQQNPFFRSRTPAQPAPALFYDISEDEEDDEPLSSQQRPPSPYSCSTTRALSPTRSASPVVQSDSPFQVPSPAQPSTSLQQYEEAATTIQRCWRSILSARKHFAELDAINAQLSALKNAFVFPESPVFDNSGKLRYTSVNTPVYGHIDALEKLLLKLDGVASDGIQKVKERRKQVVHEVEAELARVEAWKADQWESLQRQGDLKVAQAVPLPEPMDSEVEGIDGSAA